MKCYFLNARTFLSKAGKPLYIITVASLEGEVSEFFVSADLYDRVSVAFNLFDSVEIFLKVARGHVSLCDITHVDIAE